MYAVQHGSYVCNGSLCRKQLKQAAWSNSLLPPALITAARLLQQQPHLAAAPAVYSSSSSSSSSCCFSSSNCCSSSHFKPQKHQQQQRRQQQQPVGTTTSRVGLDGAWQINCVPEPAAAAAAAASEENAAGTTAPSGTMTAAAATADEAADCSGAEAAAPSSKTPAAAAAALARLQQLSQKASAATVGPASSSSSSGRGMSVPGQRELLQPIRPVPDREEALQQIDQQEAPAQDHLLTWRSRQGRTSQQQQPIHQQQLVQQHKPQQQQQQQQLPALPLEPSIDSVGRTYLTSPVSFAAANTSTKALAGSISIAFAVHSHQLMFAVGPLPLAVCLKALATARVMLAAENGSQPVNILMQPTLRGGRTVRNQSYALDIAQVGELPMQPGGSSSSSDGGVVYGATGQQQQQQQQQQGRRQSNSTEYQQQQQQQPKTDVKMVHITSASNELAAARSLVENMPARGQTVIRVAGPFAAETAVLAVALARPLFRQKYGQDLAMLVMWNRNKMYRNKQSGLLLAVFRCAVGVFPPEVLLLPPSPRNLKRQRYWQQQQMKRQGKQQEAAALQ